MLLWLRLKVLTPPPSPNQPAPPPPPPFLFALSGLKSRVFGCESLLRLSFWSGFVPCKQYDKVIIALCGCLQWQTHGIKSEYLTYTLTHKRTHSYEGREAGGGDGGGREGQMKTNDNCNVGLAYVNVSTLNVNYSLPNHTHPHARTLSQAHPHTYTHTHSGLFGTPITQTTSSRKAFPETISLWRPRAVLCS